MDVPERKPSRLYSELADWWPLVSSPADYAEEAEQYARLLIDACRPARVLELGSGGGNNASFMKRHFEMVLVDLSPEMLNVSRQLNPGCRHEQGDMRTARLGEMFDAVFVHDAVTYMTSETDLSRTIESAAEHCRPGGAVLLVPDHFRETYRPGVSTGGHDGGERSLRYMQWDHDPDPTDTVVEADFAFLLREGDGPARIVQDHHTMGLFERELWLELCRKVGLESEMKSVRVAHPEPLEIETILGRKEAP